MKGWVGGFLVCMHHAFFFAFVAGYSQVRVIIAAEWPWWLPRRCYGVAEAGWEGRRAATEEVVAGRLAAVVKVVITAAASGDDVGARC